MKELPYVLWSYRITIHKDIKETPFKLMFGQDVVILVQIRQPLDCIANYSEEENNQLKAKNLDFLEKDKDMAHIRSMTYKEKVKRYFDK